MNPPADATTPGDATAEGEGDALPAGAVVDRRYRVVRALDRGGMGAVYEAVHVALGERVALKVMHRSPAADGAGAARFLAEGRALRAVEHPHVVRVIDCGNDGGRLYLAMELLEGETLRALLDREGPLDVARAVALVDPALAALERVHAAGLVHRDVKPHNLFIARAGGVETVKLLDFGIARRVADPARFTVDGAMLGTPAYMSPEQCRGDREAGPASDQFSAAAVLHEALTGAVPHAAPTAGLLLAARVTAAPAPVRSLRGDLAPALCAALDRALAPDPARRFPSIAAFRAAIRAALDAPPPRRSWPAVAASLAVLAALSLAYARRRHVTARAQAVSVDVPAPVVSREAPAARPVLDASPAMSPTVAASSPERPPPPERRAPPRRRVSDARLRMPIIRDLP
ncbi:MAG: serine/threonine-protein kinase [Polyangiales bacterium]